MLSCDVCNLFSVCQHFQKLSWVFRCSSCSCGNATLPKREDEVGQDEIAQVQMARFKEQQTLLEKADVTLMPSQQAEQCRGTAVAHLHWLHWNSVKPDPRWLNGTTWVFPGGPGWCSACGHSWRWADHGGKRDAGLMLCIVWAALLIALSLKNTVKANSPFLNPKPEGPVCLICPRPGWNQLSLFILKISKDYSLNIKMLHLPEWYWCQCGSVLQWNSSSS